MNLEQALKWQAEANKAVELAKASNEGRLELEIAMLDEQMQKLEEERLQLEVKLLTLRIEEGKVDKITVREASLYSGYGEMSLRALANPKRAKAIAIHKVGHATYICRCEIVVKSYEKGLIMNSKQILMIEALLNTFDANSTKEEKEAAYTLTGILGDETGDVVNDLLERINCTIDEDGKLVAK